MAILEKKAARIALACSAVAFFLLCTVLVLWHYLPSILPSVLTPEITRISNIKEIKIELHKTGLTTTVSGPVTIGEKENPGVRMGSVQIHYDVSQLLKKRVDRIIVNGLYINCAYGASGFSISGLDINNLLKNRENPHLPPETDSRAVAGLPFNQVHINDGLIHLTWRNTLFRIPFDVRLVPDANASGKWVAHIRIYLRGQIITIDGVLDPKHQTARMDMAAGSLYLERFSDLIHQIPGLELSGHLAVKAGTDIGLSPFLLKNTHARVDIKAGRARYRTLFLSTGDSDQHPEAQVSVTGMDKTTFRVEARGLKLVEPFPIMMTRSNVTLDLEKKDVTARGLAEAFIHHYPLKNDGPELPGLSLKTSLKWSGTLDREGFWSASLSDRKLTLDKASTRVQLAGKNRQVNLVSPHIDVSARGKGNKGSARWKLRLENLTATHGQTKATASYVAAGGTTGFSMESQGLDVKTDAGVHIANTRIASNGMTAGVPDLSLTLNAVVANGERSRLRGRLKFSKAMVSHEPSGTRLEGIQLAVPFGFENKIPVKQGVFSVKNVRLKDRPSGPIKGTVQQTANGITFGGVHDMAFLPGLKGEFSGKVALEPQRGATGMVNFSVPAYELPPEFDLGSLIPKAKGTFASGRIAARGRLDLSASRVNGGFTSSIENGQFTIDEKKITIEGVDASLRFPDIFNLKSEPSQHIRFKRAAIGDIAATDGRIDVQVASADALFFEKIRFAWCNGTVETHAFSVRPEKKAYNITLYCDRLRLARILEQLGSVNATGTGTVNGRIPVEFNNGRFRFDDGFLYSTPGVDGKIQMTGTDILTKGIPMDTPQFAQIDLAAEALKDFDYQWAKLGLITEGENLLLKLQFDGKPARPLPFVYKMEVGGFVRVDAKSKGSVFQGIELDVNLRLPLNRLLEYKDVVNMIQ